MPTLKDVARAAGVSVCTVSQVLNPSAKSRRFTDACKRRVMKAADDLGYRPNYHARSLYQGRAGAIGLLSSELDTPVGNWFWGPVVGGIDHVVRSNQLDLVVVGPHGGKPVGEVGVRYLRERRIDALIAPAGLSTFADDPPPDADDEAIVLTDHPGRSRFPVVEMDPAPGMAEAVAHLHALGHREIVWVGLDGCLEGPKPPRLRALKREAKRLGVRVVDASVQRSTDRYGTAVVEARDRVDAYLDSCRRPPTALVCYNEHAGLGAYAALCARGLSVPRDVSVIGFDDLFAELAAPPMTTVSHMLRAVGARAAEVAIEMVSGPAARRRLKGKRITVASQLVVRESTATAARTRA